MLHPPIAIPDHPPLQPCSFCGREAQVTPYRATPTAPIEWSIGCFQDAAPFTQDARRDDCPGPTKLWLELDVAVAQWNRRAR